jgi:hypothetical protein
MAGESGFFRHPRLPAMAFAGGVAAARAAAEPMRLASIKR